MTESRVVITWDGGGGVVDWNRREDDQGALGNWEDNVCVHYLNCGDGFKGIYIY